LKRKLIDWESVGKMSVYQLSAYMRLPMHRCITTKEALDIVGLGKHIVYRCLSDWTKAGLLEQTPYEGREFKVRVQYRRLFNKVTIVKEGVLFELVKEG